MNNGDLTRILNAFSVLAETYPTHAPALTESFKSWLNEESLRIERRDAEGGLDE